MAVSDSFGDQRAAPEPEPEPAPRSPLPRGPGSRRAAALVCLAVALYGMLGLSTERGLAYDEAMHAALPAQRMALGLAHGRPAEALDAFLDCDRYPPVYPVVLAGARLLFGPGDAVLRRTTRAVFALACFGLFLLASETARRRPPRRGKELAPWLALALALASPLAAAFSGTLFLELPFVCAMVFALHAWLRRDGSARAEHRAGLLVALALFTKFNYGALLGLVLALDLLIDGLRARDRGQGGRFLVRALHVVTLPALALVGWFVLARGAEHRQAFVDFMTENVDASMAVGLARRWVDWSTFFAYSPLVLLLVALGFLADLVPSVALARAPARVARLSVLVFVAALALHPFHLDRFLLPAGVGLWVTGGLGLARLAPESRATRLLLGLLLGGLVFVTAPGADLLAVKLAGLWPPDAPENQEVRAYVREELGARRSLAADRPLPVAGLYTVERDVLLDLTADAAGSELRVGWLGPWTELSRGVLHAGLLERSLAAADEAGSAPAREAALVRFFRDAPEPLLLETEQADPGLDAEAVARWALGFDLLLFSQPVDPRGRPGRAFVQAYVDQLRGDPRFDARRLGTARVRTGNTPFGPATEVALFALRRLE